MKEFDVHFKFTINDFFGSVEADSPEAAAEKVKQWLLDLSPVVVDHLKFTLSVMEADESEVNVTDILEV